MKKNNGIHLLTKSGLALSLVALITVVALATQIKPKKVLAAESSLYFSPTPQTVSVNQDFVLDAMINPGADRVSVAELYVTFDQTKFRLDSIGTGSAISSPFIVSLGGPTIDNNNGTAYIGVGVLLNPVTPVVGVAKIATFSFHSLSSSTASSSISFTNNSMAWALDEVDNVVISRTPATVTVTGVTYDNDDFVALVTDWLQTERSPADVNSDNIVNTRDLGIMMSNWQE